MTSYKFEYVDFENEKTVLVKEFKGQASWDNTLENVLEIVSHFLKSCGFSFHELYAFNTSLEDYLAEELNTIGENEQTELIMEETLRDTSAEIDEIESKVDEWNSSNCLYNINKVYGPSLTDQLNKEIRNANKGTEIMQSTIKESD